MKNLFSILCLTSTALVLSACNIPMGAETDMQGMDPNEYYAQHPIQNKLETRRLLLVVHFMPGDGALSDEERDKLRDGLRPISPPAVDSIIIRLAQADRYDQERKTALAKLLSRMGYGKMNIQFEPSASVSRGTASIDVAYLAVVPPDCPDWRTSPVTSHSNMWQGNFKCSQVVNLGLMVADPHDLARGTGDVPISTERSSKSIQDYNNSKDFMPGTLTAGTAASGSGNGNSSGSGSNGSGSGSGSGSGGGSGGGSGSGMGGGASQ